MSNKLDYVKRTFKHIHRVHENAIVIAEKMGEQLEKYKVSERELFERISKHDLSKFNDEQYHAYASFFFYKNRNEEVPTCVKKEFDFAVQNHYQNENHHFQGKRFLSYLDMIEIVCDLQAMSQEFGEGDCEKYFHNVWLYSYNDYYKECGMSITFTGQCSDDYEYQTLVMKMNEMIQCFKN